MKVGHKQIILGLIVVVIIVFGLYLALRLLASWLNSLGDLGYSAFTQGTYGETFSAIFGVAVGVAGAYLGILLASQAVVQTQRQHNFERKELYIARTSEVVSLFSRLSESISRLHFHMMWTASQIHEVAFNHYAQTQDGVGGHSEIDINALSDDLKEVFRDSIDPLVHKLSKVEDALFAVSANDHACLLLNSKIDEVYCSLKNALLIAESAYNNDLPDDSINNLNVKRLISHIINSSDIHRIVESCREMIAVAPRMEVPRIAFLDSNLSICEPPFIEGQLENYHIKITEVFFGRCQFNIDAAGPIYWYGLTWLYVLALSVPDRADIDLFMTKQEERSSNGDFVSFPKGSSDPRRAMCNSVLQAADYFLAQFNETA